METLEKQNERDGGIVSSAVLGQNNMTTNRTPVNKQAAMSLSNGTGRLDKLKDALESIGNRIKSPEFESYARQMLDGGFDAAYTLDIKRRQDHGYNVVLAYRAKTPCKTIVALTDLA